MPSDSRIAGAFGAIAAAAEAHRSAVAVAVEEVRGLLANARQDEPARVAQAGVELGAFAASRIDVERFATLLASSESMETAAVEQLEHAFAVLRELADRAAEPVLVEDGATLRSTVEAALAEAGRAFGAARVVELARTGSFRPEHGSMIGAFPFDRWNPRERRLAPPLVIRVSGAAFRPSGLVDFLDGAMKIVLVVEGSAPPAALVRAVTPGTLVIQGAAAEDLAPLEDWPGPALAALVDEAAAAFVHDPRGGTELAERLVVHRVPDQSAVTPLPGVSAEQQREELRQLTTLQRAVTSPVVSRPTDASDASRDPADKLAAWLLQQADLPAAG